MNANHARTLCHKVTGKWLLENRCLVMAGRIVSKFIRIVGVLKGSAQGPSKKILAERT